ncbi:2-oxoacid ferredoxin oxidoreductase [bacterium]|nr:2-oxoacid ferredoxin oxidoreductase [bacterium]
MSENRFDMGEIDIAWCPGCGNFSILKAVKQVLLELDIDQKKLVMVSGIGQAAKIPQYIKTNYFNGLHGRALPAATGIKAANPHLIVIAESGDGCMYGEGGNHFIHTIRRNPDITHIVHNNMVYGLTKGQASPTSPTGFETPVQNNGVFIKPFNPIAVAIALDASFVARTYIAHKELTESILKNAIEHKGYALIDIFQPCVSFNKINTYDWYKANTYLLGEDYDPTDRKAAFAKALENEKYPLGILYQKTGGVIFEKQYYKHNEKPLFQRRPNLSSIKDLVESKRIN